MSGFQFLREGMEGTREGAREGEREGRREGGKVQDGCGERGQEGGRG